MKAESLIFLVFIGAGFIVGRNTRSYEWLSSYMPFSFPIAILSAILSVGILKVTLFSSSERVPDWNISLLLHQLKRRDIESLVMIGVVVAVLLMSVCIATFGFWTGFMFALTVLRRQMPGA